MGEEDFKFGALPSDFRQISAGTAGVDMKLDDGAAILDVFHAIMILEQGGAQKSGVGKAFSKSGVP